ncbi:MAG TPA: hypothetical protein VK776_30225 [Bryobacteraceae bacterium]|nr:hypothetical protein [Bryobacteraceae bacterium]
MRGTKYSEQQIIGILKAAEKGFATARSWTIASELNGYGTTFPLRFDRGFAMFTCRSEMGR